MFYYIFIFNKVCLNYLYIIDKYNKLCLNNVKFVVKIKLNREIICNNMYL